jgi:isopenicillin-N epimerase
MPSLHDHFLLDPDVIFLNHGSFGATPRSVLETYQYWQHELEKQPVHFIVHELFGYLEKAREILGLYVNAQADNLVFIPNATFGINIVARSLDLKPGDEILTSNHEYGACDNTWSFICQKNAATYVHQPIPLEISSLEETAEYFWNGVTPRTKIIFLSHITSFTALRMPVEDICKRAKEAGIITVIDGAHAPGQIRLDLETTGADFYIGNCHKWMLSPKGSGFLYARREMQHLLEPLVVSWGWGDNSPYTTGSDFLDNLEWWGTKDSSAYLAVPAAIKFMEDHDWPDVQRNCHAILKEAILSICDFTGLDPMYPENSDLYNQMAAVPLPHINDLPAFQAQLYDRYRIEVPCIQWEDMQFIRISIQGYNTWSDSRYLVNALKETLPERAARDY